MWIYDVVWKLDWVYKVGTSWLLGLAHRMYEKKKMHEGSLVSCYQNFNPETVGRFSLTSNTIS